MFTNIISKTVSDRLYNEDVFGYDQKVIFVIDGATGLGENDFMGCGDDAKWFVENVALYLKEHCKNESIVDCLSNACCSLYKLYQEKCDVVNSAFMPSGCISLFKIDGNQIEYYGLGDCVGYIEFVDGTYDVLYDQSLVDLDNIAIAEMVKLSNEKGISPIEARKYVQEILIHNRGLMNTLKGYYSLELTGSGLKHAISKSWDITNVKRVCCMSDGFYEIVDFHLYDNIRCVIDAVKVDCDNVFDQLYCAQQDDALGYKVPRFKLRDDTTVVYAEL